MSVFSSKTDKITTDFNLLSLKFSDSISQVQFHITVIKAKTSEISPVKFIKHMYLRNLRSLYSRRLEYCMGSFFLVLKRRLTLMFCSIQFTQFSPLSRFTERTGKSFCFPDEQAELKPSLDKAQITTRNNLKDGK